MEEVQAVVACVVERVAREETASRAVCPGVVGVAVGGGDGLRPFPFDAGRAHGRAAETVSDFIFLGHCCQWDLSPPPLLRLPTMGALSLNYWTAS